MTPRMIRLLVIALFINFYMRAPLSAEDHLALGAAARTDKHLVLLNRFLKEGKINELEYAKWAAQYQQHARPLINEAYSGYVPEE